MHIVFLGTASCFPTAHRGVSCIALRHEDGSVWLFDCGEGSQIQLQKSCIKPGKITKIFITHLHGDHLFGLPGLICTLSTQCSIKPDFILEIFGPQGLRQFVRQSLMLSRSELPFKYVVHELIPESYQIPADWDKWKLAESTEERNHPQELPGRNIKADNDNWCLIERGKDSTSVAAGHNEHLRIPSYGFVVQEPDSLGKLDVEKLKQLNVQPGPLYAQLKQGKSVSNPDGELVRAADVLGPPKIGRKVTILGDTCNSNRMIHLAKSSDVVIHEATLENGMLENALEKGHSTPDMAAAFAHAIDAKMLILTHFSQRYQHSENAEDGPGIKILLDEASAKLAALQNSQCSVMLANDFLEVPVLRLAA